jgi:TolA-binding protein
VKPDDLVEGLAHLAREASGEALTPAENAGLQRLERTLARGKARGAWLLGAKRHAGRGRGGVPGALAWIALVAALGIAGLVFSLRDRALTFEVKHGRVGEGGYVVSESPDAMVRFSDQSVLGMEPGTRLRVSGLDVLGAHMMLEGGLLHVHIHPRPRASWTIDAGPYVVHVTGTEFDLVWDVERQTLDLRLFGGKVTVEGPLSNGTLYMQAGQHLVADARDGSLSIVQERALDTPAAPAATASEPVVVPATSPPSPSASPRIPGPVTSSHPTATEGSSWTARVARGDFQGILDEAEHHGVDRTLTEAPIGDLAALADAARYARKQDVARRTLLAERSRFPGSVQARDAAFFLGSLAEGAGDDDGALTWDEAYLGESPNGPYASQALGHEMVILRQLRRTDDARAAATEYLRRFHDGPYASSARKLQVRP